MNVLFLRPYYIPEIRSGDRWPYYVALALEQRGLAVHPATAPRSRPRPHHKIEQVLYRSLLHRRFDPAREAAVAQDYAAGVLAELREREFDVILALDSIQTAFLDCREPIVLWLDATFDTLVDFYPGYRALSARTIRNGHALEREALARASLVIYSSAWAARSATATYGLAEERVAVVPWGANLPNVRTRARVEELVGRRDLDRCRLLFLGIEWERKGGPFAVEVARCLERAGIPTELRVVGCFPRLDPESRNLVHAHGFLDKDRPSDLARLESELERAHFLILPTVADCTPLAVHEAAAFGVPTLANEVGGVGEALGDGAVGVGFSSAAAPSDYSDCIVRLLERPAQYRELALAARARYETQLNWETAAADVERLLCRVH